MCWNHLWQQHGSEPAGPSWTRAEKVQLCSLQTRLVPSMSKHPKRKPSCTSLYVTIAPSVTFLQNCYTFCRDRQHLFWADSVCLTAQEIHVTKYGPFSCVIIKWAHLFAQPLSQDPPCQHKDVLGGSLTSWHLLVPCGCSYGPNPNRNPFPPEPDVCCV